MDTQWVLRNYQYGVASHLGIGNEKAAVNQMFARNRLRNALVELQLKMSDQYCTIISSENPAAARLLEIKEEIKTLRGAIKAMRARKPGEDPHWTGRRIAKSPEKARIEELKSEAVRLRDISNEIINANRKKLSATIKKLDRDHSAAAHEIYQRAFEGYAYTDQSGKTVSVVPLYHPNVNEIVRRHQTDSKRATKDKATLKFHRFEGEGRVLICAPSTRAHHFSGPHGKAKKAIFDELIKKKSVLEEDRREHLAGLKGQERQEVARRFAEQIKSVKREIDELAPLSMGMTEKEIFTPNTLFWLEPMRLRRDRSNPTVWDKSVPRSERRRCMRTIAHIRIGSGEKSKPIFLTCPIVMHRPLPLNCRILSAAVNRRRFGSKFAWTVEFIVLFANQPHTESTGSVAAVDLGWAKDSLPNADGRIRVAGVLTRDRNGDKVFREIALSSRYTAAHMKFHELQSIRDQHTNECFARLEATGTLSDGSEDVQEVLQKAIASFKAQTSGHPPVRGLRRAVWIIRSGSAASEQVSTILQSWYERYMHLNNWLVNGRANLRAFRKDFFRRIAYRLAHENDVLLLDPDDFAEMARTPQTEEGTKRMSGGVRVLSSPAELRAALQEAFADAGKTILYTVHAQGTSKTCSRCGHVHDVRVSRTFMCPACSLSMDREENAATNVLALFDQKPGSFSTKLRIAKNLQLKKEEELKQEHGAACAVSSS